MGEEAAEAEVGATALVSLLSWIDREALVVVVLGSVMLAVLLEEEVVMVALLRDDAADDVPVEVMVALPADAVTGSG